MQQFTLLLTSFVIVFLANCTCAAISKCLTYDKVINEAQSSTSSGSKRHYDEAFLHELGDLFSPQDVPPSGGLPFENFAHQPRSAKARTEEHHSTQIYGSDLGVDEAFWNELGDLFSPQDVPQSGGLPFDNFEHQPHSAKARTEEHHPTRTYGSDLGVHEAFWNELGNLSSPEDALWVGGPPFEDFAHQPHSDIVKTGEHPSTRSHESRSGVHGTQETPFYDISSGTLSLQRKSNNQILETWEAAKNENHITQTSKYYPELIYLVQADQKSMNEHQSNWGKPTSLDHLGLFYKPLFKDEDKSRKGRLDEMFTIYKLVGQQHSSAFHIRLNDLLSELTTKSSRKGKKGTSSFTKIVQGRLLLIIKSSLVQTRKYAQLFQYNANENSLSRIQEEAFQFLAYFWRFALTKEEDERNEFYMVHKNNLVRACLVNAERALYHAGRTEMKVPAAAWAGTEAFVFSKWKTLLKLSEKSLIEERLESDSMRYKMDKFRKIQEQIPDEWDERRLSEIDISTPAQVCRTLGFGARLKLEFIDGFENKAFALLQYFCEFALFDQVDETRRDLRLEEAFNKDETLENSRVILSIDSEDEEIGECISWHATEFFVWWLWEQELTPDQKNQIIESIRLWAKTANIYELDHEGIDEGLEEIPGQFVKISKEGDRRLIYNRLNRYGELALNHCGFNMQEFLKMIGRRFPKLVDGFQKKKDKYIFKRISYLMKSCFLKIKMFASFRMGGLKKAEFVNGYETQAISLLENFWLLVLFGESDHKGDNLRKENSMKLEQILENVRRTLILASSDLKKLESPSWHATSFCLQWIWHQELDPSLKTKIYNAVLRLSDAA
ncbi:hypothetical protein O181_010726 [Austropuccinia psidii MF-1]|uniref:Uncharacterized protein n=1 Tax=Austropuccinia psidii MF-1 TaxID=1389203 RepID=A0A9Q3GKP4_9BASI|nr:hypothetical protein [Austropuccinia psidii MF-1]